MNEKALEQKVHELSQQGYSQYMIALLLGTSPAHVNTLRGIFHPRTPRPSNGDADRRQTTPDDH